MEDHIKAHETQMQAPSGQSQNDKAYLEVTFQRGEEHIKPSLQTIVRQIEQVKVGAASVEVLHRH